MINAFEAAKRGRKPSCERMRPQTATLTLDDAPFSVTTSSVSPTILTEQLASKCNGIGDDTNRYNEKGNITRDLTESVLDDIQDIENEEDAVERDKDQVDDGSCGPVNHFAEEKHRKRLNAVRTREGSGRTGPLYRVCAGRAVLCDRGVWHHNNLWGSPARDGTLRCKNSAEIFTANCSKRAEFSSGSASLLISINQSYPKGD